MRTLDWVFSPGLEEESSSVNLAVILLSTSSHSPQRFSTTLFVLPSIDIFYWIARDLSSYWNFKCMVFCTHNVGQQISRIYSPSVTKVLSKRIKNLKELPALTRSQKCQSQELRCGNNIHVHWRMNAFKEYNVSVVEYYSVPGKKELLHYVGMWMNREDIMLRRISLSGKNKHWMLLLTRGI